ncbi:MAG: SsrA-binding protein SmpB [Patescibacteria group bacterium]
MPTIARNKRANLDYEILDKWEAGIVLTGPEVKSAKLGHFNLKGSYISPRQGNLFLINSRIAPYQKAGQAQKDYDPVRSRLLLVHKSELRKISGKLRGRKSGLTLVPLSVYNKKGFIKIDFGIGKGRKKYDKREYIKKKEVARRIRKALKR